MIFVAIVKLVKFLLYNYVNVIYFFDLFGKGGVEMFEVVVV